MLAFRVLVGKNIVLASPHPARHPTSTIATPWHTRVLCSILGFRQLTCLTCHAYFADNKSLKDLPQVKMLITDTQESNLGLSRSIPRAQPLGQAAISGRKFPRMLFSFSKSRGSRFKSHEEARSHPHPNFHPPFPQHCFLVRILFPDYEPACGWCWSEQSQPRPLPLEGRSAPLPKTLMWPTLQS